jgi:HAE1 family hydrophobic/amphiphilic exporter-1
MALVPDVEAGVEFRPSAFVEIVGGRGERLEIVVRAADAPRVAALAERVTEAVEARTGLVPRVEERERELPVVMLHWDEARLARLGLDRDALESQLRAALELGRAGRVSIPSVAREILVERTTDDDPSGLPVGPAAGRLVPLGALARLETGLRPALIRREDGRPTQRLVVSHPEQAREGLDAISLERLLQGLPLAADETLRLGGEAREVSRSFSQLRLALVLSVALVFLTLAALYESFLLPLLIMTTLPTAAGGALVALAVTGQTLNVLSFLGLILLGGIVVNNAIVLVQRIEQLRSEGRDEADALRRAMSERYRPILMTTLTTLLGMLPLALLGGQGMELRRALSTAVVGGLVTATFASLLLVPALHGLLERYRGRRAPRESRR